MNKPKPMPLEVTVVTEKDLELLEPTLKKEVIFVSDKLSSGQLATLNPFIVKLNEIQAYRNLEYRNATPEEKEESVSNYKKAISELKEVKKLASDTKKKLKEPIDEVGKKLVAIEKGALSVIEEIISDMDTNFKEWRDEEEKRLEEQRRKREEREKAKTAELEAQNKAQEELISKTNIINQLKYEIPSVDEKRVLDAVSYWTLEKVTQLKDELSNKSFDSVLPAIDKNNLLNEEEIAICREVFEAKYLGFRPLIDNRIKLLELQQAEEFRKKREEEKVIPENIAQVPITPAEAFPAPMAIEQIHVQAEPVEPIVQPNVPVHQTMDLSGFTESEKSLYYIRGIIESAKEQSENIEKALSDFLKGNPDSITEEDIANRQKVLGTIQLLGKIQGYLNQ
jgi:hypothetical protein